MSFYAFLVVVATIFLAEIPDKTMIAMILMASRHKWWLVALGAACAFVIHCGIAVGLGELAAQLPRQAINYASSAVFLLAGLYLLLVPEKREEEAGEEMERKREGRFKNPFALAFGVIFLGEWGDLTQILTIDFAARYRDVPGVFGASAIGLTSITFLACMLGQGLVRFLKPAVLRRLAGAAMVGLSIVSFVHGI